MSSTSRLTAGRGGVITGAVTAETFTRQLNPDHESGWRQRNTKVRRLGYATQVVLGADKVSAFSAGGLFCPPVGTRKVSMSESEQKQVSIERTGKPPLRFTSIAQWSADDEIQPGGSRESRFTRVTIHRTKGGRIVVRESALTRWDGELNSHRGESFTTAAEAIAWLASEGGLGAVAQEALAAAYAEDVA